MRGGTHRSVCFRPRSVEQKAAPVGEYSRDGACLASALVAVCIQMHLHLRESLFFITRSTCERRFPISFIKTLTILATALFMATGLTAADQTNASGPSFIGNRFLTFNTVVRVRQIEVTRDDAHGPDESSVHTPAEARIFRGPLPRPGPTRASPGRSVGLRSTTSASHTVSCAVSPGDAPPDG